jgi:diguanylate cyclase (GGDEF)-like protein
MRSFSEPTSSLSVRTPIAASLAIILIMAVFAGFSLWQTARESNQVDLERTRLAVRNAVDDQQSRLADLAYDNAEWDDAAIAVYRRPMDMAFIDETWRGSTSVTGLFDHLMIVHADGRVAVAMEKGEFADPGNSKAFDKNFHPLLAQAAKGKTSVVGTIGSDDGLRFVAITRFRPHNPINAHVGANMPPVMLVVSRPFEGAVIAEFSKKLVLKGLRFSSTQSEYSIPIADPAGKTIGWIAWDANLPGHTAIMRSIPWMLGGILLCLILVGLLARYGFRALSEMNRSALYDSLSQLPNRRNLRFKLGEAIKEGKTIALAFIDLDGFKGVNDSFGHAVGDALIQKCAEAAATVSDQCQLVARLGGDEFAILATGKSARENLENAVDALLVRLAEPFRIGDRAIAIGASIGLTSGCGPAATVTELMREADVAMYESKRAGKMRRSWFSKELDQMRSNNHAIEEKLRGALSQEAFALHYQPMVDAQSGKVVAVEALLRWNDPQDGEISPNVFVPVAEETGLINAIGLFVLRKACEDGLQWPDIGMSVNVSAAQLSNPEFPLHVKTILEETAFPPERLEIELSETCLALDSQAVGKMLARIRALGVNIALDDFGHDIASIGLLRRFAFDRLKLDGSLAGNAIHDEPARAMVLASLTVAQALKMPVTAEGVETAEQAEFMRMVGCDRMQGWQFGRAAGAETIDLAVTMPLKGTAAPKKFANGGKARDR